MLENARPAKLPLWARTTALLVSPAELRRARIALHEHAQPTRHRMRTPFAHAASCMRSRTAGPERAMCRVVLNRRPREST